MDLNFLVNQIKGDSNTLRLRQANIVSVETGYSCTVRMAGDPTGTLSKVRYLADFVPLPNYSAWVLTDGTDMLIVGHVAAAGKTVAPKAYRTTNLAVTAATETVVAMEAVESDAWGCWSAGTPSRLTAPADGRYMAQAQTWFTDVAAGSRYARLLLGGATEIAYGMTPKGLARGAYVNISSAPLTLTKGQYIELAVYSDIAVTLTASPFLNCVSLTHLGS
jgi:hypothetical protein